ncbi:MAG TPA: hypothetical protein VJ251_12295 [Stellaceae bacterium]|nr:hypothetical protein [Stellaceae bacterium]
MRTRPRGFGNLPPVSHAPAHLEQSAGVTRLTLFGREYWQRDAVAATLYSRRVSAPGDEIVLAPRRV